MLAGSEWLSASIWGPILSQVCVWVLLHFILKSFYPKRTIEPINKMVTALHSVLCITLGGYVVWTENLHSEIGAQMLPMQRRLLQIGAGYFFYDLGVATTLGHWGMTLHHFSSIVGLLSCLRDDKSGTELVYCTFIAELSTPLLIARHFLREQRDKNPSSPQPPPPQPPAHNDPSQSEKRKRSPLRLSAYDWVSLWFCIVFLGARFGPAPVLTYRTIVSDKNTWMVKGGAFGLQAVSFFWGYKIVTGLGRGLAAKFCGRKDLAKTY
ncbi:unnamed protein product [Vitrella brassicaformis CCMP3155]|uniref:TLC domain-containing protein n=2 Tax=Vitrella brassicaformis TaxID=1169539 RepID=A0A0G4GG99_VITBC|nr:unnamed protein product [Vitrella brassicaformis CCMP3155]|mmetsp:Transcript_17337/g.41666  ORF Transcript_17337/g.41666 Transcript_17337/m.41666 type:complete len:266 (+) Transcript_17337:39-836(+)|eukprot:CEM28641.1 unnamed protein product [Vitrella brassicaformis CCMP3155]